MTLTEQEVWKPMEEFDNDYAVSNLGRFKSLERDIIRTNKGLKEENQQLKELLKECDNELKILRMLSLPMASKGALSECDDLLTKIDNAIGEKK